MIMAEEEVAMRLVLMRKPEQDHVYKWPCNFDEMHASTVFCLVHTLSCKSMQGFMHLYATVTGHLMSRDQNTNTAILWKDGQSSSYWLVLWFLPYKATKTSLTQWGKSNYIKNPKKKHHGNTQTLVVVVSRSGATSGPGQCPKIETMKSWRGMSAFSSCSSRTMIRKTHQKVHIWMAKEKTKSRLIKAFTALCLLITVLDGLKSSCIIFHLCEVSTAVCINKKK